ncbi:MAG: glutamate synthase, partial [Hydrotalea flava]|nr:glutamate synthase [Hydrotalea flava]NIO93547.1 glutamate synthase [Hydrotalea flava]
MATDKKLKPKPVYIDRLPPCNNACLIGQNIQKWLSLAKKSKFQEAWGVIMQNNPMPAILGRVCYHPCEDACNRYGFDSPVNINAVERFLGDMALSENWAVNSNVEKTGKKVLVVG